MIKIKTPSINRWSSAFLIAFVAVLGVSLTHLTFAATGSLTFSPSSGAATVGSNLVITLHENSGTDAAIGVDAYVNYSTSLLQFVSATTVAPFSVGPPDSPNNGTVELVRGAYSGQTGDQVVAVLTFKVLAAGTAAVTFNSGSSSISPAVGTGNLLTASPGASYTLNAVPQPPPPTPTPTPPQQPATPSTPASTTKATSVKVSDVTVPNNGSVAVATPVSVEPATVQTDGVKKVEYYLAGKLVDTETAPPYKYNIDTTKYKNGTYDLVSKTYYSSGSVKQTTQHLIVKNVSAKTSAAATIGYSVLLLLIIGGVLAIFLRKRGGLSGPYGMVSPDAVVTGDAKGSSETAPKKPVPITVQAPPTIIAPASTPVTTPTVSAPSATPTPGTVIQVTMPPDEPK